MKSTFRLLAAALWVAAQHFQPGASGADAAATVDSVLEKYVTALGGKAKIEKIKSRTVKGDFVIMGQPAPFQQMYKGPNKFYSEVKMEGMGEFLEGVDGTIAWAKDPGGPRTKEGAEATRSKRDADIHREAKIKALFPNLTFKGTEKLGADEVHHLESKSDAGMDRLTFNAKTGFLVSQFAEFSGADGNTVKVTARLGDYKEADGIQYPFEREVRVTGGFGEFEMVMKVKEIKHDVELADSKFAKPSE